MTLEFQVIAECHNCREKRLCPLIRMDAKRTVQALQKAAEILGDDLPDAVLVLDCHSYSPKGDTA